MIEYDEVYIVSVVHLGSVFRVKSVVSVRFTWALCIMLTVCCQCAIHMGSLYAVDYVL